MSYWFVFFFNGKVNRLIWGECIPFTDVYTRIVESEKQKGTKKEAHKNFY